MRNILFAILISSALLSGCASSYKPLYPEKTSYANSSKYKDLKFSYKYDVLTLAGNKKYPKKELKKGIRLVAIKLENTSNVAIAFDSLIFNNGERNLDLMDNFTLSNLLKQGVWEYLLYSPIFLFISKSEAVNGHTTDEKTTYIPNGLAIAAGNMIGAGDANSNFRKELIKYNLKGKMIPPGEAVSGLIGFPTTETTILSIKY